MPIIPTTLSLRSLDQLSGFLARRRGGAPPLVLPFFSMVDRRKRLHRDLIEDLCLAHPDILRSAVPSSAAVERMGAHQAPVAAFDRRSSAVAAYANLWDEVLARLAAGRRRRRAGEPPDAPVGGAPRGARPRPEGPLPGPGVVGLPRREALDGLDREHLPGRLVAGHVPADVVVEIREARRPPFVAGNHEGHDPLAEAVVGSPTTMASATSGGP